jgi:hypothetical protein
MKLYLQEGHIDLLMAGVIKSQHDNNLKINQETLEATDMPLSATKYNRN